MRIIITLMLWGIIASQVIYGGCQDKEVTKTEIKVEYYY